MVDRPIIFSGSNVLAMLAGKKTQTRRLAWRAMPRLVSAKGATTWQRVRVGDRLWVREPFYAHGPDLFFAAGGKPFLNADTCRPEQASLWRKASGGNGPSNLRPARWMPKWASRVILTVTDVRREPLQEISEADAIAEGIISGNINGRTIYGHFGAWTEFAGALHVRLSVAGTNPALAYQKLWNELHGPGAWDHNPEVMAFTFTVAEGNVEEIAA